MNLQEKIDAEKKKQEALIAKRELEKTQRLETLARYDEIYVKLNETVIFPVLSAAVEKFAALIPKVEAKFYHHNQLFMTGIELPKETQYALEIKINPIQRLVICVNPTEGDDRLTELLELYAISIPSVHKLHPETMYPIVKFDSGYLENFIESQYLSKAFSNHK